MLGEKSQVRWIKWAAISQLEMTPKDLQSGVDVGDVGHGEEQRRQAMLERPGRECSQQLLRLREMLERIDEQHCSDFIEAVEGRLQRRHVAETARRNVETRAVSHGPIRRNNLVRQFDYLTTRG